VHSIIYLSLYSIHKWVIYYNKVGTNNNLKCNVYTSFLAIKISFKNDQIIIQLCRFYPSETDNDGIDKLTEYNVVEKSMLVNSIVIPAYLEIIFADYNK